MYHLARAGTAPIGIEQFHLGHPFGSSHGNSRGLRTFYHKPIYTAWADTAITMWQDLENLAGEQLLFLCGWMAFARPENELFRGNLKVLQNTAIQFLVLDPREVHSRFPGMSLPPDSIACFTPRAGFLDANRCVRAHVSQAVKLGATVLADTRVERIDLSGARPFLQTSEGSFTCSRLVLTPGPWAPQLLRDFGLPLRVTRQHKFYFRPKDRVSYTPNSIPVYVDYDTLYYGFPDYGPGIKVADDNPGATTDPDTIDRSTDPDAQDRLGRWLSHLMPGSDLSYVEYATCMYTLTPDTDFVLGLHPQHPNVVLGAGFSGHGFKFSPVVGMLLSEVARGLPTTWPLDQFRPDRFPVSLSSNPE